MQRLPGRIDDLRFDMRQFRQPRIVSARPQVISVGGANQLDHDTIRALALRDASLQNGGGVQSPADLTDVLALPFKLKRRSARHHPQIVGFGQRLRQLIRETVGDNILSSGSPLRFRNGEDDNRHRVRMRAPGMSE